MPHSRVASTHYNQRKACAATKTQPSQNNTLIKKNIYLRLSVSEGEERKGIENVFEETMLENFPNLKKETDTVLRYGKHRGTQTKHNKQNGESQKYIENSKGSKNKTKSLIQGNPHKAISWFLCINFEGQKGVA